MIIKLSNDEISIFNQIKNIILYGLIGVGIGLPGFLAFIKGFLQMTRLNTEFTAEAFSLASFSFERLLLIDRVQLVPIIFIVLILIASNYKNKAFRFFSVLSILLTTLRFSPLVASIFNGFSYPQNRWHYITFLFISVTISIGIKKLFEKEVTKKTYFELGVSCFITLSMYLYAIYNNNGYLYNTKVLLVILALTYFSFIWLYINKTENSKVLYLIITFVISMYFVIMQNYQLFDQYKLEVINKDYLTSTFDDSDTDFSRAQYLFNEDNKSDRKKEMYRMDYTGMPNLGLQQKVETLNVYSSFQNGQQQNLYRYFNILNSEDSNVFSNGLAGRSILNTLFQVDYIYTDSEKPYIAPSTYSRMESVDELNVFKNDFPWEFIHPVDTLYSYDDIDQNQFIDNLLINGAIVPGEYANSIPREYKTLDYTIHGKDYALNNRVVATDDKSFIDVHINDNLKEYDDIIIDFTLYPLDNTQNSHYFVNGNSIQIKSFNDLYSSQLKRHKIQLIAEDKVTFEFMPNTKYELIIHNIWGLSHDELKQRSIQDESLNYKLKLSRSSLRIEYENHDQYPFMVIPIFYHNGWDLKINNKEVPIINTNNGMIGFVLPDSDDLVIELNYTEPGFIFSSIVCLLSIGVLIVYNKRLNV